MKNTVKLLAVLAALCLTGCVTEGAVRANSTSEIPSIQRTYADRFENTRIGMDLSEFKKVWPEAIKSGETQEYAIYEFRESTKYYTDDDYNMAALWTVSVKSHEFVQIETFYFTDNKLVKYEYKSGSSGLNG